MVILALSYHFLLHPRSLSVSVSSLSHLVLDSVEVMASAHVSPPSSSPLLVTGSPWKQSGEGGDVNQRAAFLLARQVNDTRGDQ